MSWQAYVDQNLVGTKKVLKGAIFGAKGGKWACSSDFKITDQEAAVWIKGFEDPSGLTAKSPTCEGVKFLIVRADDRSIYAKSSTNGLCVVKTGQCVLFGYYDKTIQAGDCNSTVEKLGDYLRDNGY